MEYFGWDSRIMEINISGIAPINSSLKMSLIWYGNIIIRLESLNLKFSRILFLLSTIFSSIGLLVFPLSDYPKLQIGLILSLIDIV